jgi:hypothetical protein
MTPAHKLLAASAKQPVPVLIEKQQATSFILRDTRTTA